MKHLRSTEKFCLLALALVASSLSMAQDGNWYLGGNAGRSQADLDNARIARDRLGAGFSVNSIADDNRDTGYKLFGGYQLNPNFAIEGGYFDLGKSGFRATTLPPGTFNGDMIIKGWNLDLVGTLPLSENFSVFGRVGANYAKTNGSFAGTGAAALASGNTSEHHTNPKVGLGLQYALNESLALRTEMERYRVNDGSGQKGNVDLFSIGLIYRFGAKAQTPVVRAAPYRMPEPVAVAPPAPKPVWTPPPAVVKPAAPMPTKVTLSSDALFDFDKASVKPEGKQVLDKFAASLRGVDYNNITVTGHSDRIGQEAYNQALSTRRAEAVSSYLVQAHGISANKITTRGVDGSEPVTKQGDCAGKGASKQRIACLQPDRRVEVEVNGQR